uniref:Uncharacterized protein n=1 Tax=Pararge aegeria TaxID=116150 RepID=S4PP35_9NEOP
MFCLRTINARMTNLRASKARKLCKCSQYLLSIRAPHLENSVFYTINYSHSALIDVHRFYGIFGYKLQKLCSYSGLYDISYGR